jgi:hypothetical protein
VGEWMGWGKGAGRVQVQIGMVVKWVGMYEWDGGRRLVRRDRRVVRQGRWVGAWGHHHHHHIIITRH